MTDEKIKSLDSLEFSGKLFPKQWWAEFLANPSDIFIPEHAEYDGKKYMKKFGSKIIYFTDRSRSIEVYRCIECNSIVNGSTVIHPVWDDPSGIGGFGSIPYIESVPYCPRCEKEPNINGAPIRLNLSKSKAS
ncbi:MAG: hypothetical protein Q8L29_04030 [archaeon]|nr:hypothetical protein [archaeon]